MTDTPLRCPVCGKSWCAEEDECGCALRAENARLREALDAIVQLQRWSPNVDGRSMVTTVDGAWIEASAAIDAARAAGGEND